MLGVYARLAALAIAGPGGISLDAALGLDTLLDGWIGGGAIVFGVLAAAAQLAIFFRPVSTEQSA